MEIDKSVMDQMDRIEKGLIAQSERAQGEKDTIGKVSKETNDAIEKIGKSQLEMAERLATIEQKGTAKKDEDGNRVTSVGDEFIKAPMFKAWTEGSVNRLRVDVDMLKIKNTVLEGTGGPTNALVAVDRRPGVIPGPFRILKLEQYLRSADTTSNAVAYSKETTFVNAAAETVEGGAKPQTDITFALVNQPVQNIAHWIKISRQLSKDAPALVAYINTRMMYGVNKRAEDQIIAGNGTDPNLAGILATGNFTAHGLTAAMIGTVNPMFKLVRMIIANMQVANYPPDMIIMNPIDWASMELVTTTYGEYIIGDPQTMAQPMLWGMAVIVSNAMTQGQVILMSTLAACVYNREGVVVEMSESDGSNFTLNLITIRAERRLMLAVEIPAAIQAGSLTPA